MRTAIAKDFFSGCLNLQLTKGKDYTTDGEVFKDLQEEALAMNVTPEVVLWIAMHKHYKAIRKYCREGKLESSETIESRLMDLVNYASLIYVLKKGKGNENTNLHE